MNLNVFTKQSSIICVFYLCFCGYLVSSLVFDSIDSRSEILIQMVRAVILLYLFINTMSSLIFKPNWVNQGKGAKVIRVIGNQYLRNLDPFLMLDYFKVRLPAGFPDHPHRGFQTVTYMQQGRFYHEDFKGHKGMIGPGDLQWMTAGRGILHSEVPASYDEDSLGFQLWINLQSKNKMIEPAYQEYTNDKIQVYQGDKVEVKIISGKWEGKTGPIYARTPSYYFDVHILPGGTFELPISGIWNTIVFVYEGQIVYQGNDLVDTLHCCVLHKSKKQQEFVHKFESPKGGRFVLIGGKPLNQPIAQHGPFVMNTQYQLYQAFYDYQNGVNGFQNADAFESKIKQMMKGKKFEQL